MTQRPAPDPANRAAWRRRQRGDRWISAILELSIPITNASKSLQHRDWFGVQEVGGDIKDGAVNYYQATLKVGFRLND